VAHDGGRLPYSRRHDGRPTFAGPGHSDIRMTLALYTHATEGMQDSATERQKRPILDPAVDRHQIKGSGSSVEARYFPMICRTFSSGGTWIRTGDTMIFSHMQRPFGMRKTPRR
jgi:hypothetical protein